MNSLLMAIGIRPREVNDDVVREMAEDLAIRNAVKEAVALARRQRKEKEECQLKLQKTLSDLEKREGRKVIVDQDFRVIGMSDGSIVCRSRREESASWWDAVLEKTRKEIYGGPSKE
jgi:hypothetical protein